MFTIVVLLCHTISVIPVPVCHEEIVVRQEMTRLACTLSQPAIAEWKANSIFKSDQWTVNGFKCAPGDYVMKDSI
jgi:hypothetical protein